LMSLLSSSSVTTASRCYYAARRCAWRAFSTSPRLSDHYQTLGLPRGASKAQIKLSKKHHPDVSKDPQSKEIFTSASEAYAVLIDDRQRRAYDRSLLSRSPGPVHLQSHGYSPRAPPSSGPRASYAWEYSSRHRHPGFRQPPPDYTYTPPNRPRGASAPGGAGRHYQPPPGSHHDVLRGSRKREEEAHREMDQVRNTSSLVRALQVFAALAASLTVMGGMPGGG
ncbi:Chaperone protein DnaJ, partial [Leucoagaricus sp. SymC.cos]